MLEAIALMILGVTQGFIIQKLQELDSRMDSFRYEFQSLISKIPKRRDDL